MRATRLSGVRRALVLALLSASSWAVAGAARADDLPKARDEPKAKDEPRGNDEAEKPKDEKKEEFWRRAGWLYNAELDALFLRGNSTVVHGSNHDGSGLGFTLGTEGMITGSYSILQVHFDYLAHLGGGATGLDGAYRTNLLGGIYVPIGEHFGPYMRLGAGGEYRGNDSFLYSHLDLPEGQIGFTTVYEGYSLEAGVTGGVTIGGRYNTGNDQKRVLDGAPMGGVYAQAHLMPIYLRGEYRTYSQNHDHPLPEELRANACAAFPIWKEGTAAPFLVCFDGTWLHGAGTAPGAASSTDSNAAYLGLSIGVGALMSGQGKESKDRPADDKSKADGGKPDGQAPDAPRAASTGALDADDTRRLAQDAISYLGGSRTMTEWLSSSPRPIVLVLPFTNRIPQPVDAEVLESPRREVESSLVRGQAAVVIDRPAADRALAGRTLDDPSELARVAGARYAVTGYIEQRPASGDRSRAAYALTVRVVDAQTNAVVWQRESTMTKITQQR